MWKMLMNNPTCAWWHDICASKENNSLFAVEKARLCENIGAKMTLSRDLCAAKRVTKVCFVSISFHFSLLQWILSMKFLKNVLLETGCLSLTHGLRHIWAPWHWEQFIWILLAWFRELRTPAECDDRKRNINSTNLQKNIKIDGTKCKHRQCELRKLLRN